MKRIRRNLATSVFILFTCSLTYGQIDFTAGSQFNPKLSYGKLIDPRDGIVYKTIEIGTQTWLAENLRYKISDGSFAYDNNELIAERYGRLYEWHTATKVCPNGWHLPGNHEWNQLVKFLGGEDMASIKMKSTIGWESPKEFSINSSGFSALGAGYRHDDCTFGSLGANANFWSGTSIDNELVWGRNLNYTSGKVFLRKYNRSNFYSVRCIKD